MKAIYPGSFDPITYGHVDIIKRAACMFDELIVVIMINEEKTPLFSTEERLEMLKETVGDIPHVTIQASKGLTVDFAHREGASVIIRGIRAVMDYEYELQQSTVNMMLADDIETVFLLAKPMYSFLSSSSAKTVAYHQGDLSRFVPDNIAKRLKEKLHQQ
ncbi:MAG: pantetheine-phosphate adenylyltransferase [Erysipelotrichaceae bacterium]|nr:pantetheine-phosphate adenylyltransferase [Erysipelotrichaceae bacterium]